MVYTVPNGYEDAEALRAAKECNQVIENKEILQRKKAFLFVIIAFVIVCSTTGMRDSLGKSAALSSSNNLFQERSLKGLFGLCGKKGDPTPPPPPPPDDGFTQLTWSIQRADITVSDGATKMYKVTVPKGEPTQGYINNAAGAVDIYLSFTKTKPADTASSDIECHGAGFAGGTNCNLGGQFQDATVYAWAVNTGGSDTTFAIGIGPPSPA